MDPWTQLLVSSAAQELVMQTVKKGPSIFQLIKPRTKILILGASGVGKTAFIQSLTNDDTKESFVGVPITSRTVQKEIKKCDLAGKHTVLIDTPGHSGNQDERAKAIRECMHDGITGLINVVCYGNGYETGQVMRQENSQDEYRELNRRIENKQLSDWKSVVGPENTKWVVTLVTKADLWWDDADAVEKHYNSGAYKKALGNISARIPHIVLPYCSVIQPCEGLSSAKLFGDKQRSMLHANFIKQIAQMIANHK
jgi:hypothetical protein